MSKYILMTASPALKGKAKKYGFSYLKMAIVELEEGFVGRPKMISPRAKGVERIVGWPEVHYVGSTPRSYGYRRLQEMRAQVETLNKGVEQP